MKKIVHYFAFPLIILLFTLFSRHLINISLYRRMVNQIEASDTLAGLYNPYNDIYACSDQLSCEHERGHQYDARGASKTWRYDEWRSTNVDFRANIDLIHACTTIIFANKNILHTQYPKISKVLMAIEYEMSSPDTDENEIYREIYASLYSFMKIYRWDIYHYQDVEDIAAQQVSSCQNYLERNGLVNS